jgi:hypothetical protein
VNAYSVRFTAMRDCGMDTTLERDGTGGLAGHDAEEALGSVIRIVNGLLDDSISHSSEELRRYSRRLAHELHSPLYVLADEFRREHGDRPTLRLSVIELEQRLRERPAAF